MTATHQLIAQINRVVEERRFEFAALPTGWSAIFAIAGLVAVCWIIFAFYRTEGRRGASSIQRMFLAVLRCLVILTLAGILVQPVLATYLHRWIDSYCIVLVDDSSSMDLRDRYREPADAARVESVMPSETVLPLRRTDVVEQLLTRNDYALLEGLREHNRVKVFTFSDAPELIGTLSAAREQIEQAGQEDQNSETSLLTTDAALRTSFDAQGSATNIARAVRSAIESLSGAPLAGVVVFSDGGFNQGDPLEVVARFVGEQGVPLHVVGIGDPAEPRNVRITEIAAPENAFESDPFSITVHIATQGMAGDSLVVGLYDGDSTSPLETRTVSVSPTDEVAPIVFTQTRETLGRSVYRVEIPVREDESVSDDNTKTCTVNVIDDKMRVLLISGSPSWEYRYLSRLLVRDETFDVSCWLQSADTNAVRDGNTIIDALPATPADLFKYDAVVMLDPDPAEFGPGWAKLLADFTTEHAGGVLYAAARPYASTFLRDPAVARIVQLLPVTPDPEADLILNRVGHYQTRDWPIEIEKTAIGHPILKRPGASSGAGFWRDLPGVYWHYPVLREKPVATVLLRHGSPQMRNAYGQHVLMATQFAGSGRTAYLGIDSTWRWRRQGDALFNTFWVNTLRYLVEGKLLGAKQRASLFTDGDTFQIGEAVMVTARLFDARFEPLEIDSVTASFGASARTTDFKLNRLSDRPGWYEGRITPNATGHYRIALTLHAGGAEPIHTTHEIQVVRPNIEVVNPRMNRAALQMLAERSPGGRYYDIDEIDSLTDSIADHHELTTVRSRPEQLWDRWWTLAALIGLLSLEWAVRKWVRLL